MSSSLCPAREGSLARSIVIALIVVCAVACSAAGPARAGSFQVAACSPTAPNNSWVPIAPTAHVTAYDACGPWSEGIVARNSAQAAGTTDPARLGEEAAMQITAAPGTVFTGVHADMTSGESAGWQSGLQDDGGWFFCGPVWSCVWDSTSTYVHQDLTGRSTSKFRLSTVCGVWTGCSRADVYARSRMRNIVVDVSDTIRPELTGGRGSAWTDPGYMSETETIGFDARDGSGIQRMRVELDPGGAHGWGWPIDVPHACDYTRTRPCSDHTYDGAIDTTWVPDGMHTLRIAAQDAAGNWQDSDRRIAIDNTSQEAPLGLVVGEGSAWRPGATFTLAYSVPGSFAPVAGRFELCRIDGTSCSSGDAEADGAMPLTMPAPGQWHVRVRFDDVAGNPGAWSDWSAVMRYDPTVPGLARPQDANGWINRSELPGYTIEIPGRDVSGPSGSGGFAITLDGSLPGQTPNATATFDQSRDKWIANFPLWSLPEGTTTVRARAISGAGVMAPDDQVGVATVRIDLTPPTATAQGAAADADSASGAGWVADPLELQFIGTDQAALSGMRGAPVGDPITTGAYMQTKVDDGPWDATRGDTATLTLAETGDHLVSYRAVDLAGNIGATKTLRIRLDLTAPGKTHVAGQDWSRVESFVEELGIDTSSLGPSGLKGYSVTTDGSVPDATVDVGADGIYRLGSLPEGVTTIRARAVSNAGLPAADADVGAADVKIDRSSPSVSVAGAPADTERWQGDPVTLRFAAADQAGLSGVDHIAVAVDNGVERRIEGSGGNLVIDTDGSHTVAYKAVDRAGNVSPVRTLSLRVDTTPPLGGLLPIDPADPTKVDFFVAEGCITSATIEMRSAGGSWRPLETHVDAGHVTAHIPDEAYAAGNYELRAVVTDCAGHTAVLDRWWEGAHGGETATVHLPLRIATVFRSAFGAQALSRACVKIKRSKIVRRPAGRHGRSRAAGVAVTAATVCPKVKARRHTTTRRGSSAAAASTTRTAYGYLSTADGRPLGDAAVEVQIAVQGTDAWRTVSRTQTDLQGVARAEIPLAGPSRLIRFVYGGTQTLLAVTTAPLELDVAAKSSIHASRRALRNGERVTFTGTLAGGYVPAGGRELELDGYNPLKHRWQPVQTKGLRADARGRWKAAYRFTSTRGRITYRFRLRIAAVPTYPFAEGYSNIVSVNVTG